jgi:hypothetical protein
VANVVAALVVVVVVVAVVVVALVVVVVVVAIRLGFTREGNPKVPDRSKTRNVPSLNPPHKKFPEGDSRREVP